LVKRRRDYTQSRGSARSRLRRLNGQWI
jgi:hypothetical protein